MRTALPRRIAAWMTPGRLAAVCLLPMAAGLAAQVGKHAHWFADFEAMACAGHAINTGQPLYAGGDCPGMQPTSYVYAPAAAQALAALQRLLGERAAAGLYLGLYGLVLAGVFYRLLRRDARLAERAPFLAGLSASALHSGNLSILVHGAVLLGVRTLCARPWLALPPMALAACVKPTFAVYFLMFVFLRRAVWQRLALAGAGVLAVAAHMAWVRTSDPALYAQWQAIMHHYAIVAERGQGFLGLPGVALLGAGVPMAGLYGLFAGLLLASGLLIAARLESEADRAMLGVAVCLLLYPRLMAYDWYTLPFGMAAAIGSFRGAGRWQAAHLAWSVRAALLTAGLIGGRLGGQLLFAGSCAVLVTLAWVGRTHTGQSAGRDIRRGDARGGPAVSDGP